MTRPLLKIIFLYGLILAAAAFALQWIEYQYYLKIYPNEIYIILIATLFAALGIWVGYRLTARNAAQPFERNVAAQKSLGISKRELEVLDALALGQSNKEIARSLEISPNTIKTHVSHIFEKLAVDRRVLAIEKARALHLIS
jgi:DNA-binding NarL/FixJ family response regulator